MASAFRIPLPIRWRKLTEILRINNVPVYVHWSVFLISGIMLLNVVRHPLLTLAALLSYLSVILLHECGHMIAARQLGCSIDCIKLYPIFGLTCYQTPWSRFDHCMIAWGGVVAQAIVGIPLAVGGGPSLDTRALNP